MRRGTAVIAIAFVALASACQVSKPPPPPAARGSHVPANFDPCSLLSADEVTAAFGTPVIPRLLMPVGGAGGASAECWYEADIRLSEQVLLVPWSEPQPLPDGPRPGTESVPGIGVAAQLSADGGYRSLNVWRKGGVGFELAVISPTKDDATARRVATDLARKAVGRLEAVEPGRPSVLPAPVPAPVDVCQLLPLADQVKVLGWADTATLPTPWEFVGGSGGGAWECNRMAENESLTIALTKAPVAEQELRALGKPLPGLPRNAFFVELPPRPGGVTGAGGVLLTTGPDGRMLKLVLFDGTDAAKRRAALTALARLIVPKLP